MPKYGFMISKAVDIVARKLAGMDSDTVARLTQILSEEAQMISEELQYSGENVSADILAAKLEGLVARMKYEVRNQGPDPSPYEFPIFNVSHNPQTPYPNPINHLYDKRYKEAYSTFIKQNQPPPPPSSSSTSQKSEPSTPTSPQPPPTINPNSSSYPAYTQGQSQQQTSKPPSHSTTSAPPFSRHQPPGGWQYVNPYATMPRSQAAQYQQQASKIMPTIQEQPVRRSSTGDDMRQNGLSRSASSNDLNYSTNPGAEKIRVRVINDNSGSSTINPQVNPNNHPYAQRSNNDNQDIVTRRVYASPETELGTETLQDLFKVVNKQRADPRASPMTERVIIIDRRGAATPDNNVSSSGVDRVRTFEIRSTPGAAATPSSPTTPTAPTTATPTSKPSSSSSAYAMQQPNIYAGQQQYYYAQPKVYASVPNNLYAATPYVSGVNNFYPFGYYPY